MKVGFFASLIVIGDAIRTSSSSRLRGNDYWSAITGDEQILAELAGYEQIVNALNDLAAQTLLNYQDLFELMSNEKYRMKQECATRIQRQYQLLESVEKKEIANYADLPFDLFNTTEIVPKN